MPAAGLPGASSRSERHVPFRSMRGDVDDRQLRAVAGSLAGAWRPPRFHYRKRSCGEPLRNSWPNRQRGRDTGRWPAGGSFRSERHVPFRSMRGGWAKCRSQRQRRSVVSASAGQRRASAGSGASAGQRTSWPGWFSCGSGRRSAGIVPRRPAWKSSKAWTSSARVFMTNGP